MSKELKKNLPLKYEELSDVESAALSGGAPPGSTTNNPNDDNFGLGKSSPRPNDVDKRQTQRF